MEEYHTTQKLPSRRNYILFVQISVGLLWAVYLIELLTPIRFGDYQDRAAVPLFVPLIGTPLVALCTWWRYHRTTIFAFGCVEIQATVLKIARFSTGPHKRVRLSYNFEGRLYERSFPLYNSVVEHLQVGSQIPILVLRHSPRQIEVPMNMEPLG